MNGIKIKSIEMNTLYGYDHKHINFITIGDAVLDFSLFTEYMLNNTKFKPVNNMTYSFVMTKYNNDFTFKKKKFNKKIFHLVKKHNRPNKESTPKIKSISIVNKISKYDLRDYYYVNGFTINWTKYYGDIEQKKINDTIDQDKRKEKQIKLDKKLENPTIITYKRLCRSTGKAKDGDCLFVDISLYNQAYNYLNCGIELAEENSKIIELSSYNTLTMANMINSINLPLNRILIMKDQPSPSMVNAVIVKAKKVSHDLTTLDYGAMEKEANDKSFTFRKDKVKRNTGLNYIDKPSIKTVKSIMGNDYIVKTITKTNSKTGEEFQAIDKLSIEEDINEFGYTFVKSKANKPGYILLEKRQDVAEAHNISLVYNKVYKQELFVDRPDGKVEIPSTMWDGMGIIDHSVIESLDKCKDFIYCRNHLFKACMFDGLVIQYLKDWCNKKGLDYNTATITDKFGIKYVKDILAITTDKAIKFEKFDMTYQEYDKILEKYDYKFSVVKTGHNSKYYPLQRMSYQGTNTIPCSNVDDLTEIARCSFDFANNMITDDKAYINYLDVTKNKYSKNNFIIDLYKQNEDIFKYKYFKNKRTTDISKFKRERLQLGKLMQNAENLTIAGNVYALLEYAVGNDWKNDPTLNVIDNGIQCFTRRFDYNETLCGYRSPHNSPNNYCYYENHYHPLMDQYFPYLGDTVICINMIKSCSQSRKNGHDMDTDSIYCTNQPTMVKYAKVCWNNYPTIINKVPEVKDIPIKERKDYKIEPYGNDMLSYSRMDNLISKYQYGIGQSSNLSMIALSHYFDELTKTNKENTKLQDIFIMMSVLAQLYIDSAKRGFAINLNTELKRINRSDCLKKPKLYPNFYATIQANNNEVKYGDKPFEKKRKEKKLKEIEDNRMENCQCPMDIIASILDKEVIDKRKTPKKNEPGIPMNYLVKNFTDERGKRLEPKCSQKDKILGIIKEYDNNMKKLNGKEEDYHIEAMGVVDNTMKKLNKLSIGDNTMLYLIRYAFNLEEDKNSKSSNNNHIIDRLLVMLYNYDSEKFLKMFKKK